MVVDCCCSLLLLIVAGDCCCWLLLLVSAVDWCCLLLLLVTEWLLVAAGMLLAGWLLLAAGRLLAGWLLVAAVSCLCWPESLWIFPGYWWFATKTSLQAKKSFNIFGLLIFAAKQVCRRKSSGWFQDTNDLWLRQFCRRQSLWIFSGYWWFAAETSLQAKKSLNISRILMRGRWKRFFPRGSRVVDGSKRMIIMVVHWVFKPELSRVLSLVGESQ